MVYELILKSALKAAPRAGAAFGEAAMATEKLSAEAGRLALTGDKIAVPILSRASKHTATLLHDNEFDQTFKPVLTRVNSDSWMGQLYKKVSPFVGRITSRDGDGGSAFVLKDNFAMSAYHSLSRGTNKLPMQSTLEEFCTLRCNDMRMSAIKLPDGSSVSTELVAYNEVADIAILRVLGNRNLSGLKLAENVPAERQHVAAIGFPRSSQFDQAVLSPGTSMSNSRNDFWFQSRAGVRTWKGNSGGPIVNEDGDVFGLVSSGNPRRKIGVTQSPTLKDIREMLTIAKAQKPGDPIVAIQAADEPGKLIVKREPIYNWWNESSRVQRDMGKDVDPRIFEPSV